MNTQTLPGIDSAAPVQDEAVASQDEAAFLGQGKFLWLFSRTAPYLGAIGAVALAVTLLATMYFTWLNLQWVTFLSGILVAAVLSIASRSARAEWLIARRTAQLALVRDQLARETRLRTRAEQSFANVAKNIKYLDELMPAMLAHVDGEQHVDYHNRAFRLWLGLSASHVDGRHLRDVVGGGTYADIESDVAQALAGQEVHRERTHQSTDGGICRLLMQYIPQYADAGSVAGVFLLLTDITCTQDVSAPPADGGKTPGSGDSACRGDTYAAESTQWEDGAERLKKALEQDEFCLYSQSIKALNGHAESRRFCEILLRLNEEEEGLMPPGTFLQLAEQHGMLPDLDRWVVRRLLAWIGDDAGRRQAVYSINVSPETIADKDFLESVRLALHQHQIPGATLCFEFQEADVLQQPAAVALFAGHLKRLGCRSAICGVGANRTSFDLLKLLAADFIKIDGGLILNILRSPVDLARVKAIHSVAREAGVVTIAECVEDGKTLEKLHALGVCYAQGFGVSRPRRLQDVPPAAVAKASADGSELRERMAA